MKFTIEGLVEAQNANRYAMLALRPSGKLGQAVKDATVRLHRYATNITHVITGSLQSAHRMGYTETANSAIGEIYLAGDVTNSESGVLVSIYGPVEHDRGGSHAFYERTFEEDQDEAVGVIVKLVEEFFTLD